MMMFIMLILSAATSFRCASRVFEITMTSLQLPFTSPSWYSGRLWLLRVGYYKLTRKKEKANDWVWIVDHTIQIGTDNGEIVFQQLEEAIEKTGVPKEIIGDQGSDLAKGIKKFCQAHPETCYIYDIKHKTAAVLKHELEHDEKWLEFTKLAAKTKLEVQQTEASNKFDHDQLFGKLGWIMTFREELKEWEELLQIISTKEIYAWCKNNIGQSVQSMRKEAFSSDHKTEQKWDQIMGDA
jgi:hypothetical protein